MAKSGVVFTNAENLRSNKIFITAQYSGAKVTKAENFVLGETNRTADYLRDFPNGAVPAFRSNDGKCLGESNAIAYYVANNELRGKCDFEAAAVMQWMHFADSEITSSLTCWAFDKMGIRKDKEANKAKEAFMHTLAVLDDYLKLRTYLVGDRVTLADIACYCALHFAYKQKLFNAECEKKYVNVHRWFCTCVNQPQAKAVLGECCEEKKATAAAADDEPEKKKEDADPFLALPKGTFIMDEWKRTFSNNEFVGVALPYLLEKFDKSCYSIWACEYKPEYAKDLTHVFMTCNLVNGMFQRLDRMRKHAFGCMGVSGVKDDNTISGLFIWRGQQLAFELSEDLQVDYESYDWRKLDFDAEETKKMIGDYFGRTEDFAYKGKSPSKFYIYK